MLKNAIVIMFDSLGTNYVHCYGNEWIKTPNMDRLAREGVLFENCYIEGLPTVPCRRAMHTGRYTLPNAGWIGLTTEDTTIADLCWGRPIDTALIYDCPMYRLPKFGYTRGFDKTHFTHGHESDDYYYENDPLYHYKVEDYVEEESVKAYAQRVNEKAAQFTIKETLNYLKPRQWAHGEEDRYVTITINHAIRYLEEVDRNKQFYLWIDSFDPHEPWDPPSVWNPDVKCPYDPDYTGKDVFLPYPDLVEGLYTEPQLHHIRMLYAELVTLCDKNLGKLLDTVRRLGFEDNTLVWVVSDHGEPMGHGKDGHGLMRKQRPWPYEELVHAPSILKVPGVRPGQRIAAFTQSVDVAPTVCDWLGIGIHPDMQGKSLLPLIRGEVDKVHNFAIAGYYGYSWAIYTEEWSYIHWLKGTRQTVSMTKDFYGTSVDSSHLVAVGGKGMFAEKVESLNELEATNAAQKDYQENITLDGAAQWTCTPSSSAEVPEIDELYDRRVDPYQLNNIIAQHPDVAVRLLETLTDHILSLKG